MWILVPPLKEPKVSSIVPTAPTLLTLHDNLGNFPLQATENAILIFSSICHLDLRLCPTVARTSHATRFANGPSMREVPVPYFSDDGRTEHGQVVHVQRIGFGGYRVTFNRGSDKIPIYEMKAGSWLPKAIVALYADPIPLPKSEDKKRSVRDIKSITDILELDSSTGRGITKFRVRWRTPPQITFPTRSNLSAILGKAAVDGPDGIRERLIAKKAELIDWHQECRRQGWHPNFRQPRPIPKKERALYPWIFGLSIADNDDDDDNSEGDNSDGFYNGSDREDDAFGSEMDLASN